MAQDHPEYTARTAHVGSAERSAHYFEHALDSGTLVQDALEVRSFSDDPKQFEVYAADMTRTENGRYSPAPRAAAPSGPGAWIQLPSGAVAVAPRSTQIVEFTIEVPFGTPPGEYRAALMVEDVDPIGDSSIRAKTRLGVPIIITVLAEVNLQATLTDLDTHHTDDGLRVGVVLTNTGDVTFTYSGFVEAKSWGGSSEVVSPLSPADIFVAPGESISLLGVWNDPPRLGRSGVRATITATVGEHQPVTFSSEQAIVWFVPWSAIVLVLVVLAVAIWVWSATQTSRERWLANRREERAVLEEYRAGRRAGSP